MRIEQLTFTRFVAAISIVIYHFGDNTFPFNHPLFSPLFKQAYIGVSYFFFLSGFVMIIAYKNKLKINPFEYMKNRFGRIYPVYLVAILLMILYFNKINFSYDNNDFILNLLVLQAWVPGSALSINTPGWSL